MKIINLSKTFFLFFILLVSSLSNCLAWEGYDFEEKTRIDIGPGNLVREGMVIQFYDIKTDSYHTAKVLLLEHTSSGSSTVKVEDLDDKKERVFVME